MMTKIGERYIEIETTTGEMIVKESSIVGVEKRVVGGAKYYIMLRHSENAIEVFAVEVAVDIFENFKEKLLSGDAEIL